MPNRKKKEGRRRRRDSAAWEKSRERKRLPLLLLGELCECMETATTAMMVVVQPALKWNCGKSNDCGIALLLLLSKWFSSSSSAGDTSAAAVAV